MFVLMKVLLDNISIYQKNPNQITDSDASLLAQPIQSQPPDNNISYNNLQTYPYPFLQFHK